jgi:tRNA-modifying protein YgfZ
VNTALFDLSARAKFRVLGGDRMRFLNGQITNDIRKATESAALQACVLSAKGKMNAHLFLSSDPDYFLLDADPELREALLTRLERYVIADDVQIEDITDRFAIFHVLSPVAPNLPRAWRVVSAERFREPGWDTWIETGAHDDALQQLSRTVRLVDAASAEVFRIEQGIPGWGRELTEEVIPIEANLEGPTIDYEKGCYIGQEVISRIKMSGQINKRLCGLVSLHDRPLLAGMKLASVDEGSKQAGWITSATRSDSLGKEIALGYVKRGFNSTGSNLGAFAPENPGGPAVARVEVVDLPFPAAFPA